MIRRTTVLFLEVLIALVVVAVIGIGAVAWRLSEGPIEIDWARPHLSAALSDPDSGLTTQIGSASLQMSAWDRAFDVVAENVVVLGREGAVRARIGAISVALSPEALLAGRLAPRRIDVLNPVVTVVKGADGNWTLTPNDPETGEERAPLDLGEVLRALVDDRSSSGTLRYLRAAELRGARVRLVDDARARTQVLTNVSGGIELVSTGMSFRLSGRAEWPDADPTPISVAGEYRPETNHINAEMRFEGLQPAAVAAIEPKLGRLAALDLPLSGVVEVDGAIDGSGLTGAGKLTLGGGTVLVPEINPEPLTVAGGNLSVTVAPDAEWMALNGSLDIEGALLALKARASRDRAGYAVIVDAAVSNFAVDSIKDFWPPEVSDGAREWVTENLVSGQVTSATLRAEGWVDGTDPSIHELDTLTGTIDFQGVETHYFRPLPPVLNTHGSATFDAKSMAITVQGGHLGNLTVETSDISLVNLDQDTGETAYVEVVVRGPAREALELIDREPLGYPTEIGLNAKKTAGTFGARLKLEIPLIRTLDVEDIGIAVSAKLKKAVIPDVLRGKPLTDGDLALDLTAAGMSLAGTAKIGGVPARITHEERFQSNGPFRSRSKLSATADVSKFNEFGLDLSPYAAGPVALEASVTTDVEGNLTATIDGDLQATSLTVPEIAWDKPADTTGIMRLEVTRSDEDVLAIPGFEIRAGTLYAAGAVDFPVDGGTIASFSTFRLGRTEAAGRVESEADGSLRIAMEGPVIDLVPILDGNDEGGSDSPTADVQRVEARFVARELHLLEDISLANGTLAVRQIGSRIEDLSVTGSLNGDPMRLMVQPAHGRRLVTVATNNAGSFLRAFGIADSLKGGRLRVDGELIGDGLDDTMDLAVRIDDFHIVDAPVFAQLLSVASFTGLFDTLSGDGIRFARATAHIGLARDTIRIDNGVAYGPGLGLKINGTLGRKSETIDVEGLIAPAYSLSRLIDVVPVIGELLTGGEGEGLLATSFAVSGSLDKPTITVNPLTALAPGFLRDILDSAEHPSDGPATWTPPPGSEQDESRTR
ncbi:AsmA-like C-terminal domain-containing protein [Thalassobaculum sp. OXR-137]|uniref:YhdP family protein n=1 Tax=Thalassobaculum sp. OXR-137 TaxID=3100173 RepID=UPI002AC9B857|nr:AsmA-like C-terminal domain-containing protein [Thalassobaculum sp. OXR-137]WPZ36977.1 AsmA-like C-terminal domain-containing protein [Thalassobaculum sp. OXR-137]